MWKTQWVKTTVQGEEDSTNTQRLQWMLRALLGILFSSIRSPVQEKGILFYSWGVAVRIIIPEISTPESAHDHSRV